MNELLINDIKYQVIKNEYNEITSLRRYNQKSNMWVKINFSNEENNIDEVITEYLSNQFLSKFT